MQTYADYGGPDEIFLGDGNSHPISHTGNTQMGIDWDTLIFYWHTHMYNPVKQCMINVQLCNAQVGVYQSKVRVSKSSPHTNLYTSHKSLALSNVLYVPNLWQNLNPRILNGQLVLTNCLARALTSAAQEALQVCQKMVKKVRDCVKYVKASEALEEYFPDLKQLQVLNTRNLSLDDQTKWNTTYEMLLAASELKEEFSRLDTLYLDYFRSPSGEDWNLIQLELTCTSTSEDNIISTITKPMLEGFDKYWKSSCFVLAIAVVMDPRFKMKLVDLSFAKIFVDEVVSYINIVDGGIHHLFLDYAAGDVTGYLSNGDAHGLGHTYFDDFIMESASQQLKSELDQYLEESLLPKSHKFDVMRWWKLNEPKYLTLSKMAHEILTLPVSTVDPESIFDTGVKEMDRYRCALKPCLLCIHLAVNRNNTKFLDEFVNNLSIKFSIKDLGTSHQFLGVEVISTPSRSIVGSLQYLAITRPDVSFAVNKLSQFMHAPTQLHLQALKRVLRYLKGTIHHGLFLNRKSAITLTAFSNSNWGGIKDNGRSTTAYILYLGSNIISWRSARQKSVSVSSTEASTKP
ncbi:zinc finger BED domain-containing protein DAYSLEEPER-like protein [Tanacetum coccineum]|uniref:Zinc finger BED domain-containing protein DAYSLEEPER-like protein n=1 Tax=Tanacetum coccineum TaxID=301880 RepID=A0ABQ5E7M4_9ASTR